MMGLHPGGRVTACSVRCSILEYLMEMMVIFISSLGSISLGGDRKYSENLGSTIEEHRPCHFRSSTIGSVTAKEPFPAPTRSLATREARRKA
ncbi:hypothetical protein F2Q69_00029778 [Brassica cretica]|uniref:Uncharacterized protein n=1 Tax=Brassica cretica TaxID=69181 RepID=A0A8S9SAV1_BRACR|nr:hypothetical protein F2Q69_00029778 [Brassica cretica]